MAGQAISVNSADEMITKYAAYMTDLGVNMEEQTQSVSFTIGTLINWLNSVSGDSDEIRICMGTYPDGANAGRTTVILWPYKNDSPAERSSAQLPPFNEGQGRP